LQQIAKMPDCTAAFEGAIMSTRKPEPKRKPNTATSPLIEWPTKEELQLLPVTVGHEEPARDGETWHVEKKH
jgi:hypothetical protein